MIEEISRKGDPHRIQFPRPYLDKADADFSFSGLKSAVRRYVETHDFKDNIPDVVAGFQEAVADVLTFKLIQAAMSRQCSRIAVVGGVAANSRLREKVKASAAGKGFSVFIPSLAYCGDNAAMIAATGYHYLQAGHVCSLTDDVYSKVPGLQLS